MSTKTHYEEYNVSR